MHDMCPAPFPDIRELLDLLRKQDIQVAMVTGKGPHSTKISLRQFGLTGYFGIVETGSPNGPRKAEGIAEVLKQWPELNKEAVIYVGDMTGDITASRTAGIPVIAAAWAPTAEPEALSALQPDELFYTVQEFKDWLLPRI